MAKGKNSGGEQMDLLDVRCKNEKKISAKATEYIGYVKNRMNWNAKECVAKQELLELVEAENLTPLKDGKIKFACDGQIITVTPRDKLIQVKPVKTTKPSKK
jgi:hypothetical protein